MVGDAMGSLMAATTDVVVEMMAVDAMRNRVNDFMVALSVVVVEFVESRSAAGGGDVLCINLEKL